MAEEAPKKEKLILYRDCGTTFSPPPDIPTQVVPDTGITFDFNYGLRLRFEPNRKENYRLVMADHHGQIIYDNIIQSKDNADGVFIQHDKKYLFRYAIKLYHEGQDDAPFFEHVFNLKGQKVAITMNTYALGDNISWFPYYNRLQEETDCELYVEITPIYREILEKQYPNVHFVNHEEFLNLKPYATYYPGLFWDDEDHDFQPTDFRISGLHKTIGYILNTEIEPEEPARFDLSAERIEKGPYVCIATQSTGFCKLWSYPDGWNEVCRYLKSLGYRVLCIDRERFVPYGFTTQYCPSEAEDYTGMKPLQERINLVKDAEFFVGLSSGLSWLAWSCKVPVVMISGFTHPSTEFYTPYRVHARNTCNDCWNNASLRFTDDDPYICPKFKDNANRKFECTRCIHPGDVIEKINKIPCVQKRLEELKK